MFTFSAVETNKEKSAATWLTAAAGEPLFATDLQPSKKSTADRKEYGAGIRLFPLM